MYELRDTTDHDIDAIYSILQQWPEVHGKDYDGISYWEFVNYFKNKTEDSFVFENNNGLLLWAYTTLVFPGGWSDVVLIKDRGKTTPSFLKICQEGLDHLFEKHDLMLIRAFARDGNTNAVKLIERLGFLPEGKMRAFKKVCGQWNDYLIYGLMKEDRPWDQ